MPASSAEVRTSSSSAFLRACLRMLPPWEDLEKSDSMEARAQALVACLIFGRKPGKDCGTKMPCTHGNSRLWSLSAATSPVDPPASQACTTPSMRIRTLEGSKTFSVCLSLSLKEKKVHAKALPGACRWRRLLSPVSHTSGLEVCDWHPRDMTNFSLSSSPLTGTQSKFSHMF